jgi:hypothetical protein
MDEEEKKKWRKMRRKRSAPLPPKSVILDPPLVVEL